MIGKAMCAGRRHRAAVASGHQHVVQHAAVANVIMHVARRHQRQAGFTRDFAQPGGMPPIVGPLVQLGQEPASPAKHGTV